MAEQKASTKYDKRRQRVGKFKLIFVNVSYILVHRYVYVSHWRVNGAAMKAKTDAAEEIVQVINI